ncbi:MAG: hypothetical protein KUG77_17585, partial [Nannocystaceae bacterium]|nr:hypothetical protein [Nannocystaceae bacterium]
PDGLNSFPGYRAKGSLVRTALGLYSFSEAQLSALPKVLREVVQDPPTSNRWVPEVEYTALCLALADAHGWSDREFAGFWYELTKSLIASVLYAGLLRFLTPKLLLRTAPLRWAHFHQGVTLKTRPAPGGLWAEIEFPEGLVPPICTRAYADVLQATVDSSGRRTQTQLVEETKSKAVYRMFELG